ncbi:hypothetical protein AGMMS50222_09080 [Endomicrobiia bacterium]|nr:hypothetical protein AGMMS50222_09080 [Endomicrobiia bacterium]
MEGAVIRGDALNNFGDDVFCKGSDEVCDVGGADAGGDSTDDGDVDGVGGGCIDVGAGGVGITGEVFGNIEGIHVSVDGVVDNGNGMFESFGGSKEGVFDGSGDGSVVGESGDSGIEGG